MARNTRPYRLPMSDMFTQDRGPKRIHSKGRLRWVLLLRNASRADGSFTETYLEAPISKFEAWVTNMAFTFSGSRVTSTSEPNTVYVRMQNPLHQWLNTEGQNYLRAEQCALLLSCPAHSLPSQTAAGSVHRASP